MPSRKERQAANQFEAIAKLAVLTLAGLAFMIGGIQHFTAVLSLLLMLIVGVTLVGFGLFFVIRSGLSPERKLGIVLAVLSACAAVIWIYFARPIPWTEIEATVTSIKPAPAVTEDVYAFLPRNDPKGPAIQFRVVKNWPSIEAASTGRRGTTVVYYKPSNPREIRFDPAPGFLSEVGTQVSGKLSSTGESTASLRLGEGLWARSIAFTATRVDHWTVGQKLPVYLNPQDANDVSLVPAIYRPKRNYYYLAFIILGLGAGIFFFFINEELLPRPAPPPRPVARAIVERAAPTTRELLHRIDWFQFEATCSRILVHEGWDVTRSGGANPDGGADMTAVRASHKAVIQCKHWRNEQVGIKVIRELLGTKVSKRFAADQAILFTLSDPTLEAKEFAAVEQVVIRDSIDIVATIERVGLHHFSELNRPDIKACPKCGAPMVLRNPESSPFWGCSTFGMTRCTGRIEVRQG